MPSYLPDIILQLAKDLNTVTRKKFINDLYGQADRGFSFQLREMEKNHEQLKLTLPQAKALRRNINEGEGCVVKIDRGIRITLGLSSSAKGDPAHVEQWADLLNLGSGKNPITAKTGDWLAIPFTQGPFEIVDFAANLDYPDIVKRFVETKVVRSHGKPALKVVDSKGGSKGSHKLLLGKVIGSGWGWEPIATLLDHVDVPQTRWADTFLYNIIKALKVTV